MQGILGKKNHNHFPNPAQQKAEEKQRKDGKQKVREKRGKRTRKIMEEIQDGADLETIQEMGDQQAVMRMLRRFINL